MATILNDLARLYHAQRRYEAAEPLLEEALAIWKQLKGEEHPDMATSYWNLGVLYDRQGRYQKAKSLYLPALEIYQKRLGTNHPSTQSLLSWINALPKGIKALPLEDFGL